MCDLSAHCVRPDIPIRSHVPSQTTPIPWIANASEPAIWGRRAAGPPTLLQVPQLLPVRSVRWVENDAPPWVEVEFVDSEGERQAFKASPSSSQLDGTRKQRTRSA